MTKRNSDRTHRNTLPEATGALRPLTDSRPTRIACACLLGLFCLLQPFAHWHEVSGAVHSHSWDEHGPDRHGESALEHPHPDDGAPGLAGRTHGDEDATPLEISARLPLLPGPPELDADRASSVCLPAMTGRWFRGASVFEAAISPEARWPSPARAPPAWLA
jgi:hypothetical protein